jgi:hypothetical protein
MPRARNMIISKTHQQSVPTRIGLALFLVIAADFLLFDRSIGLSLAIFAVLLVIAIVVANPTPARALVPSLSLLIIGLIPLIEDVTGLSVLVALISLVLFALAVSKRMRTGPARIARQVVIFLLVAPVRLVRDFIQWRTVVRYIGKRVIRFASIAVWLMPVILTGVFITLFGIANPVIERWLSLVDFRAIFDLVGAWRSLFWFGVIAVSWAFLRPRLHIRRTRNVRKPLTSRLASIPSIKMDGLNMEDVVFGRGAIVRALLLFNALFAIQTGLDAAYLWGGAVLPDGVTYASYAHGGAYPLIATALLAAMFVLVAMRPGSATSADRHVRALIYLWTAQNVVLVISSMLRLDLYVSIYSLTYWRVTAFIWMLLVAAGLVLIMARIALGKSNEWLFAANLLTLSATLYICCYVNFAALIAGYNVNHSRAPDAGELNVDIRYLSSLGPDAIPVIDTMIAAMPLADIQTLRFLEQERQGLSNQQNRDFENWRAWTFRGWRLSRYLAKNPSSPSRLDLELGEH